RLDGRENLVLQLRHRLGKEVVASINGQPVHNRHPVRVHSLGGKPNMIDPMGSLHYGSPPATFDLDDRTLAHVELVVLAKLRRHESFALTIDDAKDGRQTIWINSSSTLRFEFATKTHEINREWL